MKDRRHVGRGSWLGLAMVLAIPMGLGGAAYIASTNGILLPRTPPHMRGRILALQATAFLGSTPIGGPLTGWLAETYDPRVALLLAGVTGLSAAWAARVCFARLRERSGEGDSPDTPRFCPPSSPRRTSAAA